MKYRESSKDKKLRQRFANDNAHALLRRIRLETGELRGINSLDIRFEYPITAIAGKNGAGKSTILALACCAYHNLKQGFKLPKRKTTYYTFSDFFVHHTEEIQKKFIDRLKDACLETHTQVICTTHSKEIFDCLPYDARFFIECVNGNTKITDAISSEFAFSKMSAVTGKEMDILVEDEVAKSLLQSSLPASLRSRVTISVIGSATALARQLAALYVRGEERPTLAIFDGDQRAKEQDNLSHAQKMAENVEDNFADWFQSHITYLPGDTWPEAWIVQKGDCIEVLSNLTSSSPDALADVLEYGLQAGKHHEFFEIAKHLGLDRVACLQLCTISVCKNFPDEFEPIVNRVSETLAQNG